HRTPHQRPCEWRDIEMLHGEPEDTIALELVVGVATQPVMDDRGLRVPSIPREEPCEEPWDRGEVCAEPALDMHVLLTGRRIVGEVVLEIPHVREVVAGFCDRDLRRREEWLGGDHDDRNGVSHEGVGQDANIGLWRSFPRVTLDS